MIDADLGYKYLQYVASMVAFIQNQTQTTSNQGMTWPFKVMWGQKPNLNNLPLFGCKAHVYILDVFCGKLDAKTKDYIFLGYAEGVKAWVFLAIDAKQDMEIKQLDVNLIFLYDNLNKEINLKQLEEFQIDGTNGEKLVSRLWKAIYKLKQVGQVWWKLIDLELEVFGFTSNTKDVCVYYHQKRVYLFLLAIYVDDLIIASKFVKQIAKLKSHF